MLPSFGRFFADTNILNENMHGYLSARLELQPAHNYRNSNSIESHSHISKICEKKEIPLVDGKSGFVHSNACLGKIFGSPKFDSSQALARLWWFLEKAGLMMITCKEF